MKDKFKIFKILGDSDGTYHQFDIGTIVTLSEDDGTTEKLYRDAGGTGYYVNDNDVELIIEEN